MSSEKRSPQNVSCTWVEKASSAGYSRIKLPVSCIPHRGGVPTHANRRGIRMPFLSEAAFARRKRRKAAVGNRKWTIPPGPPLAPMRCIKRLHMFGGSGCRGLLELPHKAEASLYKVAAQVPLRASMQPQGKILGAAGGTAGSPLVIVPERTLHCSVLFTST